MALSWENLITQHDDKPPILIIHGQPGTGKTTLAASAPRPIFLATEDGLGRTDELASVPAFRIYSWQDFLDAATLLAQSPDKYDTVVIDSLDHLEQMVWAAVAARENKPNIESFEYGKGYVLAGQFFAPGGAVQKIISHLRDRLRKMVIMIAHSAATKENPPDLISGYTRWSPKLHKHALAPLVETADGVFYAMIPIVTSEQKGAFGATATKATAVGDRRLYMQPGGSYLGKTRWRSPEWVPLSWDEMSRHITGIPGQKKGTDKAA